MTPREASDADRRRIEALAADLPETWHDPDVTVQDRQTIIRCLVERITAAVRGETEWVNVTIRWFGGLETRYEIRRPVKKYEQLSNYRALRDRAVELRRGGRDNGGDCGADQSGRISSTAAPRQIHRLYD